MTRVGHRGIDMSNNKNTDSNVTSDEKSNNKEADLKAQIKRDQDFLIKVFSEETVKRKEISENLKKFHEMVDEKEDDIKEGMKKEYLTDSKMMLDKINSFKEKLKNNHILTNKQYKVLISSKKQLF